MTQTPRISRLSCYLITALICQASLLPTSTVTAAPMNWKGPYVGGYVGWGFGNNHLSTHVGGVSSTSYFATPPDVGAVNTAGSFTNYPKKAILGIQVGHDWACNQIIYGAVLDYGALPFESSKAVTTTYPDNPDTYSTYVAMSTRWLATLRGRVGFENTLYLPGLIYVTGGGALTKLNVQNNFRDTSAFVGRGYSNTTQYNIGWTAGLGVEVMACDHVSVNVEYLYLTIPSVKTTGSIANTEGGFGIPVQSLTNPFTTTGTFHASLIKVGLNYKFDE